ncbi:serine/threonine-protein kinase [Labedella gwakjiensis]|uniref:non-specific serine/threonine protein kinase n=2 Tax=Labedella gwakjiensis TaxID=390269 RepID=A0A2P8GZH1_9MICO|nr:serine/threonine-protein kinase [Labedella gwakjiensis]RUQ87853.1 Stk1 family PASTA domain-containing Ser/Thr kinase [Labedella gwakjiensis]
MIGRLIDGRYLVRSRIARGGMATVYLATDQRLERRVAIKIMHGHLSDDSTFKNRFVQEARSAARLANPHVVSVFDQGQDSDMAYLVMEYLPGITLRELLSERGTLSAQQVVDIMDAVLTGLAAAHRAGIVHRDVKPENVLLADDGRIKISDFGLARAASANTATGQALLGTIAYLSPELVTRGIADTRSDIYALGIMMYEMLTGEQPYKGEQPMQIAYQHANDSVPRPSARNAEVPDELDDLVLWATERDPEQRPANAGELLERLHEIERQLGFSVSVSSQSTTFLPPLPLPGGSELTTVLTGPATRTDAPDDDATKLTTRTARRRRKGFALFLVVLLLAALAGGTGWYFGSGPGSRVQVPSLSKQDPAAAEARLTELGFEVATAQEYSFDIEEGLVTRTDPGPGTFVDKDGTVTLYVSQGRQPVSIGMLQGATLAEVQEFAEANRLTLNEATQQFSADVPKDVVISVTDADGTDFVKEAGTVLQGATLDAVVSVGGVPDVVGQGQSTARNDLESVGLTVNETNQQEFSDEFEKGQVIRVIVPEGPLHPNDSVTLVVSKGQDLVEVPDVTGKTIADAKATLEDLGFVVDIQTAVPEDLWGEALFSIVSQDPGGNTSIKRGSTVSITANL